MEELSLDFSIMGKDPQDIFSRYQGHMMDGHCLDGKCASRITQEIFEMFEFLGVQPHQLKDFLLNYPY